MNQTNYAARWNGPLEFGFFSCAILFLSACGAPDSEGLLGERQSAERGETVFDYNCGYCHGTEGRAPGVVRA